ncbi:MAG TPA: FAD binding domain-containing protein [Acidobacteriota bacterium]|nr:FAD binding domain-containing protein [Acidobacteriota bacterium]
MNRFEFASPGTVESAVQLLGPTAVVLAGGTDLLSLLKDGVATPERVVSLKGIRDLHGIEDRGPDGVRIGAMVTVDELMESPVIRTAFPALVQAADGIRSMQIRSVGTVGGDLCQRPRCRYFRNGFGLLAMREGKSMVPEGDNRYHAILGNGGPAFFVNPSSFAPALIALGAEVVIRGKQGTRRVPLETFYRVPKSDSEREYDLAVDEIVTEVLLPNPSGKKNAVYEVRQKEALDWPLTAAAVALQMDGDTVSAARVVLGHVAPIPWVSETAAQALVGKAVTAETAEAAGTAAVQDAKPLSRNAYKVKLAKTAVQRAVLRAAGKEVA